MAVVQKLTQAHAVQQQQAAASRLQYAAALTAQRCAAAPLYGQDLRQVGSFSTVHYHPPPTSKYQALSGTTQYHASSSTHVQTTCITVIPDIRRHQASCCSKIKCHQSSCSSNIKCHHAPCSFAPTSNVIMHHAAPISNVIMHHAASTSNVNMHHDRRLYRRHHS